MNYLAHIFLSGDDRWIQVGNFVGDGVKGRNYRHYPLKMQQGILLHRSIDRFADTHALIREAVGMGRGVFGRYAGVVNDILFDHFLAMDFQRYATLPLRRFAWRFYAALLWRYRYLPERFQHFLWHFILTDRLCAYASLDGVCRSLEIMNRYRGVPVESEKVLEFVHLNEACLREIFRVFFPEIQQMCNRQIDMMKYESNL